MTMPDTPPPAPSVLDEALRIADHGIRVLPIKPGEKRPPMTAWQDAASNDPAAIANWFTNLYRDHGLGVATGQTVYGDHLFVLDVDEHGTISGGDTLHDLEARHGALPETVEVATGSGGRHLYYLSPVEIRNDAGRKLGPGLDIRGQGGQVVAPPTVHPTGRRYEWVIGHALGEAQIAQAPAWLVDLLTKADEPAKPTPEPRPRDGFLAGDGPADRYNASTTWEQLLTGDGWTLSHVDADGEQHWTRPGKAAREGTSATVGYQGQDVLVVFTSSIPWLPEGTYSRFGYLSYRDHGGDFRACARALVNKEGEVDPFAPQQVAGDEPERTTWEDVPLDGWLDGTAEEVLPTILERVDGGALLYPGRINMLFGQSGSGKSWVALAAVAQLISQGRHVAYIDLEDHPRGIVRRLGNLGAHPDDVRRYLHYKQPSIKSNHLAIEAIRELVDADGVDLVVVDSYGEALALFGFDQNDDNGVATFTQAVLRPWTRLGAGVLLLDHIPKSDDSPKLFAIGSQRKLAAVDGAAFRINQVRPFAKGVDGKITIVCAKDRGGTYPTGFMSAEVDVLSRDDGDTVELVIRPAEARDANGRPRLLTGIMENISRYLEPLVLPASKDDIRKNVKGKNQFVDAALAALVDKGFVRTEETTSGNHRKAVKFKSAGRFREGMEAENDLSKMTLAPLAPYSPRDSGRVSEVPQNDTRPTRPAYKEIGGEGATVEGFGGELSPPDSGRVSPDLDEPFDLDKHLFP